MVTGLGIVTEKAELPNAPIKCVFCCKVIALADTPNDALFAPCTPPDATFVPPLYMFAAYNDTVPPLDSISMPLLPEITPDVVGRPSVPTCSMPPPILLSTPAVGKFKLQAMTVLLEPGVRLACGTVTVAPLVWLA